MPDVRLDAGDAAELTKLVQFLSDWLARDPGGLGASLKEPARAIPPMALRSCARTWTGSSSCPAAATASACSAPARQDQAP